MHAIKLLKAKHLRQEAQPNPALLPPNPALLPPNPALLPHSTEGKASAAGRSRHLRQSGGRPHRRGHRAVLGREHNDAPPEECYQPTVKLFHYGVQRYMKAKRKNK
jgi:hypothetical protein